MTLTTEPSVNLTGHPVKRHCPFCGRRLSNRFWEGALRRFCRHCNLPIYENPIPAVCAVVPDDRGRLLLVRRGVEPKIGAWCLPGGFMELGETPETAALRELREEAGLNGRIASLLGLYATPSRLYHTILLAGYLVMPEDGRPRPGDDATAVGWFDGDDLPTIAFDRHLAFIRDFQNRKGPEAQAPGR